LGDQAAVREAQYVGLLDLEVVEQADQVVDDQVRGVPVGGKSAGRTAAAAKVGEDEPAAGEPDQRFEKIGVSS
jgi:hypothetical protein